MDDKTIDLQEYKETKRQASIEAQKKWEEDYKQAVMSIANSAPTPTTTYTTEDLNNEEVRRKVDQGVVVLEDRCVCCGRPVTEGRMVCEECERAVLDAPSRPLPPKTWERSYEERFGEKKPAHGVGWIRKLFSKD